MSPSPISNPASPAAEKAAVRPSIITTPSKISDTNLINEIFSGQYDEVVVLSTGAMLNVSKDSYPLPWMAREIGQNMSDHNPGKNKGSINGVDIRERHNSDGSTTIEVIGHWHFADITGAIMNHSHKDGDAGQESAGGNGVGLKQAAIRFVRDYGVQFEIHGGDQAAGWQVSYKYLKAEEVNKELESKGDKRFLKHDYFCAAAKSAPGTNCCKYVFTTKNKEVLEAIINLHKIMVCDHNPQLQNLDFKNDKGGIKWLTPNSTNKTVPKGHIFMNGQIYGYLAKGESDADYWQGPQGVTVQLNNISHRRTMDRPPLSANDFAQFSKQLTESMTKNELLSQLKKSEALWSQVEGKGRYDSDRPGWQVIVDELIWRLRFSHEKPEGFATYVQSWTDRKFVSAVSRLSEEQIEELKNKGYSICPASFHDLGMPDAKNFLDVKYTEKKVASIRASTISEMAQKTGIPVATSAIEVKDAYELMAWLKREVSPYIDNIKLSKDGTVRVNFKNLSIPEEAMASLLFDPRGEEAKALYAIRSFMLKALSETYPSWISSDKDDAPTTLFSGIRTSYSHFYDAAQGDQLTILNDKVYGSDTFLEFKLNAEAKIDPNKFVNVAALEPALKKQVVTTDSLDEVKKFSELFALTSSLLADDTKILSLSEDNHLLIDLGNMDLSSVDPSFRYHPKSSTEKLLYKLRSIICCGLRSGYPPWIQSEDPPLLVINGIKSRCSLDPDGQLTLEQMRSKEAGAYIKLKLSDAAAKEAKKLLENIVKNETKNDDRQDDFKESRKFLNFSWPSIAAGVALVSTAAAYFLSNPKPSSALAKDSQGISQTTKANNIKPNDTSAKATLLTPQNHSNNKQESLLAKDNSTQTTGNLNNQNQETPNKVNPTRGEDLTKTIQTIDSVIEQAKRKDTSLVQSEHRRWIEKSKTQTQNNSNGATTTRSVDALVDRRDQRDAIAVPYNSETKENSEMQRLREASSKLTAAMNNFAPNGHLIENFKILDNANPDYKRRLNLLAEYLSLTTGVKIQNNLFVFQGSGAYGVNIEKSSIGLHEELLKPLAPFTRALETFIHEVAHNASGSGHELEWRHAYATLAADAEARIYQILSKHRRGILLDQNEQKILNLRDSWHLKR